MHHQPRQLTEQAFLQQIKYGMGLTGRVMYFLSEAPPVVVMLGILGLLFLAYLAVTGKRTLLYLTLFGTMIFSGSIFASLNGVSQLLRFFVLPLICIGLLRVRLSPGLALYLFGGHVAVGVLMTVFSPDIMWTLQWEALLAMAVLAAVVMANDMLELRDIQRICVLFVLCGLLWGAIGGVSLGQLVQEGSGGKRFGAATESTGVFTQNGGILLPFAVWGAMRPWGFTRRAACGFLAIVILFVLVVSAQRTWTLAGVIACLPLFFRLQGGKVMVSLALIGAVALIAVRAATINERQAQFIIKRYINDDLSNRDKIWMSSIDLLSENPLLGHGFGSNKRTFRDEIGNAAHNAFISVWYDTGIFGLLLVLGSLAVASWQAFQLIRRPVDAETEEIARLMLGLLMAISAGSCFTSGFSSPSDIATVGLLSAMAITWRLTVISREELVRRSSTLLALQSLFMRQLAYQQAAMRQAPMRPQ